MRGTCSYSLIDSVKEPTSMVGMSTSSFGAHISRDGLPRGMHAIALNYRHGD